jgi:ABC-type antimicrobial peptide transport system permease subunit
MAGAPLVVVDGMRELSRDLRAMDRKLQTELRKDMQEAAKKTVLPTARGFAPRKTGRLAGSLRAGGGVSGASIRSPLPYANFIYWGGSVGPGHIPGRGWSGSVKRKRRELYVAGQTLNAATPFVHKAFELQGSRYVNELGDSFERFAKRHGWN